MRVGAALSAPTLIAVLALSGCGGGGAVPKAAPPKAPVTFHDGPSTPTSTIAQTTTTATIGPQKIALQTGAFLAPATSTVLGQPVNGILCQNLQQLAYRGYVHLQVYYYGQSRALPGGIGMLGAKAHARPGGLIFTASTCYYWLHTRAADGVILIESPKRRDFSLGDFFRVWDQPLGTDQVAQLQGPVTVLVNGKRWTGTPGAVPLNNHDDIELAIGKPIPHPPATQWFAAGL
jgi:hypothetical protein